MYIYNIYRQIKTDRVLSEVINPYLRIKPITNYKYCDKAEEVYNEPDSIGPL